MTITDSELMFLTDTFFGYPSGALGKKVLV